MREEVSKAETLHRLRVDPKAMMIELFSRAHKAIEASFTQFYEEQGWVVGRTPEGYLIRARSRTAAPICVHGGTTATLVVVLDGRRIIVSNVGDSTAIMTGLGTVGSLRSVDEWAEMRSGSGSGEGVSASTSSSRSGSGVGAGSTAVSSATVLEGSRIPSIDVLPRVNPDAPATCTTFASAPEPLTGKAPLPIPAEVASSYMEISADHSPESHTEFKRMHGFRPHLSVPHNPELLFVYDTLQASKMSCPSIFEVNPSTGTTTKTERGAYYKNVRCEWATLVATPPHAPFQDALAFTRSLGDLHLQTYGVSHVPETWWMDLTRVSEDGKEGPLVPYPLSMVVCSDGIWDNWKFEEVAAFALTPARVSAAGLAGSSEAATVELMAANLKRGQQNFGSSADNMTAIIMYLFPRI